MIKVQLDWVEAEWNHFHSYILLSTCVLSSVMICRDESLMWNPALYQTLIQPHFCSRLDSALFNFVKFLNLQGIEEPVTTCNILLFILLAAFESCFWQIFYTNRLDSFISRNHPVLTKSETERMWFYKTINDEVENKSFHENFNCSKRKKVNSENH